MATKKEQENAASETTPETEGTIHFAYDLKKPEAAIADQALFIQLKSWRQILLRLGLVGQTPGRYQGLGFGNLSARDPDRPGEFIITASQTGAVADLEQEHITRVVGCNLQRFWVEAIGEQPPSSETLTHAMLYAADPRIEWVFHGHSPEIWERAEPLALPCTDPAVGYGSPEMVAATAELLANYQSRPLVFATRGHIDGVFSCGATARDTGGLLVSYLAKALG
jgi:hypothetical protein